MGKRMNIFEGMRMGQKLVWTKTELRKFEEYDQLMAERCSIADSHMTGMQVGDWAYKQLEGISADIEILEKDLQELMGSRRFRLLIGSTATLRAWRGEIFARYLKKHPEASPEDCMPGWE